jgi:homogentisate 1,2-dioxygenase
MTEANMDNKSSPQLFDGLDQLGTALDGLGSRRVLVICGKSRRFVDRVKAQLGWREVEICDIARTHVPKEVVDEAAKRVAAFAPDTLVSVGGGAATGLAKALRLTSGLSFVAVPTTYSGSEHTSLYGISDGAHKRTGVDSRVLPDAICLEPSFTLTMDLRQSTTSLLNSLAHPISALWGGDLDEVATSAASRAAREMVWVIGDMFQTPDAPRTRRRATLAAGACARCLMTGNLGPHHRWVHTLGGNYRLEHATLHSLLLPHSLRALRLERPEVSRKLHDALGVVDLEGLCFDFLLRAGADTALAEVLKSAQPQGEARLAGLVAQLSELGLPETTASSALLGRRPSTLVRSEDWGWELPFSVYGPSPREAHRVIIAYHGRGSTADSILRRAVEVSGDDANVCVLAPQAPSRRWGALPYRTPVEQLEAQMEPSLDVHLELLSRLVELVGADKLVLFGFSQGACLALELLARVGTRLAGVVALSGARFGGEHTGPPPQPGIDGTPLLVGVSEADPWIDAADVRSSAAQFQNAGCRVVEVHTTGDGHELYALQRLAARSLLRGAEASANPSGFGNASHSEDLPGALPSEQNTPRHCPYGLYSEQVNESLFTVQRAHNRRTWLYRIRPSARTGRFDAMQADTLVGDFRGLVPEVNLSGFSPRSLPDEAADFVDGLRTIGGAGSALDRRGFAIHSYAANRSMEQRALTNSDGAMLLVPVDGELTLLTEHGPLRLGPGRVALLPRGVAVSVLLHESGARGFVAEVFGRSFILPERGPLGANGTTDARHFEAPAAWHEDRLAPNFEMVLKLGGRLHRARVDHSPFDVVAWHGTSVPYVYDLRSFSPAYNARFDHGDPSIHTVLSCPLDEPGVNLLDFVIFTERWDATQNTFRPPYPHRNAATEFNGVIKSTQGTPFEPGVSFLTPPMTPHAPGRDAHERFLALSDAAANRPNRLARDSLWFQFESALPLCLTHWARSEGVRIEDWSAVWGAPVSHFAPRDGGS